MTSGGRLGAIDPLQRRHFRLTVVAVDQKWPVPVGKRDYGTLSPRHRRERGQPVVGPG